jgi:hypothetical protein
MISSFYGRRREAKDPKAAREQERARQVIEAIVGPRPSSAHMSEWQFYMKRDWDTVIRPAYDLVLGPGAGDQVQSSIKDRSNFAQLHYSRQTPAFREELRREYHEWLSNAQAAWDQTIGADGTAAGSTLTPEERWRYV